MAFMGTFLRLLIKTVDTDPIPVIIGKSTYGYFVCLPGHDTVFEFTDLLDLDTDCFTCYMNDTNAKLVAEAVKHGSNFLCQICR